MLKLVPALMQFASCVSSLKHRSTKSYYFRQTKNYKFGNIANILSVDGIIGFFGQLAPECLYLPDKLRLFSLTISRMANIAMRIT